VKKDLIMPAFNMNSVPAQKIWEENIRKEDITRLLWHDRAMKGDSMGA